MADAEPRLAPSAFAFMQDLFAWPDGVRRVPDRQLLCVRHRADSVAAPSAFRRLGLPWPERVNDLCVQGGLVAARRQPEEVLLSAPTAEPLQALARALDEAGDAFAVELSDGTATLELDGRWIGEGLSHLVDPSALPGLGRASRCRFIDVPVLLWRVDEKRLWLLADRALSPYLAQWFSHAAEAAGLRRPDCPR